MHRYRRLETLWVRWVDSIPRDDVFYPHGSRDTVFRIRDLIDELEHIEWPDVDEIARLLALELVAIPLLRGDEEEGNQIAASYMELQVINPVRLQEQATQMSSSLVAHCKLDQGRCRYIIRYLEK